MGRYTQLYVGGLYFSWKGMIPSFLGLPFDDEESYQTRDEEDPDSVESIGYVTNCSRARQRLDDLGFSMEFCQRLYTYFLPDLKEAYVELVSDELEHGFYDPPDTGPLTEQASERLAQFRDSTERDQLIEFIGLLQAIDSRDPQHKYFSEPYVERDEWLHRHGATESRSSRRNQKVQSAEEFLDCYKTWTDSILVDFSKLSEYLVNGYDRYPPCLIMLCCVFSWDFLFIIEYPELIWLLLIRLAVEAMTDGQTVRLELSDIIDDEAEAKRLPTQFAQDLIDKIKLYGSAFEGLFRDETSVRNRYMRTTCRELLTKCDSDISNYEKGRLLEQLVELLFTANGSLELADRNLKTSDEEIDLAIKNTVDRPFWQAFGSPLIFVECKNWTQPVGTAAIRDFEMKIQNHGNLVKLGFFVSLNGYTSEAKSEMKRIGRDRYHLVLLQRSDIEQYIESADDFFIWLESRIAKIY